MNYNTLKTLIVNTIKDNDNEEITGQILQDALISIVDSVGEGNVFKGIVSPTSTIEDLDSKIFYFATEIGEYTYFNSTIENVGIYIFVYNIDHWDRIDLYTLAQSTGDFETKGMSQKAITTAINNSIQDISGIAINANEIANSNRRITALEEGGGSVPSSSTINIKEEEEEIGKYTILGTDYPIYKKSLSLIDLPKSLNETRNFILADQPLGKGLYLKIDSLSVSDGSELNPKYYNYNYHINLVEVNEVYQTVLTIECTKAVVSNYSINGIITIKYIKPTYEVVEFDVNVPDSINKDLVNLTFPKLKYNKDIVFTPTIDDTNSIYQYIFCPINKRPVVTKSHTDYAYEGFNHLDYGGNYYIDASYVNPTALSCTNGTGIKCRYNASIGSWYWHLEGGIPSVANPYCYTNEMKLYKDFGTIAAYHDLIDGELITSQEQFDNLVHLNEGEFKSKIGYIPKVLIEPNGDRAYSDYSKSNKVTQSTIAQDDTWANAINPFKDGVSLSNRDVIIKRLFGQSDFEAESILIKNAIAQNLVDTNTDTATWYITGMHRVSPYMATLLKDLYDLYGAESGDNLWIPSIDEYYEYWYMKEFTIPVKTIYSDHIHYKLLVPTQDNFFFKDLSLRLSNIDSLNEVSVSSSDNCKGTSFAINKGQLMINLDFDEGTLARAEKYLSIYENNQTKDFAYDDAEYFINKLKVGVIEPYLARLNVNIDNPPILNSISINSGAESTNSLDVSVYASSGGVISDYKIGETSDLSSASWQPYTSPIIPYTLSSGYEIKNVYIQLKNDIGESSIMSDSIEYKEQVITTPKTLLFTNNSLTYTTSANRATVLSYSGIGFINPLILPDIYVSDFKDVDGNDICRNVPLNPDTYTDNFNDLKTRTGLTTLKLGVPNADIPTAITDDGTYPSELLVGSDKFGGSRKKNEDWTGIGIARGIDNLAEGNYRVKILYLNTEVSKYLFESIVTINGVSKDITTEMMTEAANKNDNWLTFDVSVGSDGYMAFDLRFKNEGLITDSAIESWKRIYTSYIGAVEINKL